MVEKRVGKKKVHRRSKGTSQKKGEDTEQKEKEETCGEKEIRETNVQKKKPHRK